MNFDKLLDYVKGIDLTKATKDKSLKLSDEAEEVIAQLMEVSEFAEEATKKLREGFLKIAQENPKLKKYEGEKVSVGYRTTRRKAIKGNPDEKFYELEKKPNTKAINAYVEATGDLPVGIEESVYEYITFKIN